jgi:hypothetical protein|tara:strand:- start:437 stop:892 length:456 start_codon:yes stop_codon:yes gene_type:complete
MRQQMKGGTMYGLKGNRERMRKKFIGEKMGSDKGTKRKILNKKKKPVKKKNLGGVLGGGLLPELIGKKPLMKLAESGLGGILPMAFARKQKDKRKKRQMEMASAQMPQAGQSSVAATGANQMQRMMMGGMMKRSKPIDGLATKGKTKGSMR